MQAINELNCYAFIDERHNYKCPVPVGIGDDKRFLPDEKMTASSSMGEDFSAKHGRLLNPVSAWCADPVENNPLLGINFDTQMAIFGVATQGHPTINNYVKKYKIGTQTSGESRFRYSEVSCNKIYMLLSGSVFWFFFLNFF